MWGIVGFLMFQIGLYTLGPILLLPLSWAGYYILDDFFGLRGERLKGDKGLGKRREAAGREKGKTRERKGLRRRGDGAFLEGNEGFGSGGVSSSFRPFIWCS